MSLEAAWVGAEKYKFENGEQEVILPNATFLSLLEPRRLSLHQTSYEHKTQKSANQTVGGWVALWVM